MTPLKARKTMTAISPTERERVLMDRIKVLEKERDGLRCCGNCDWFDSGSPTTKGECTSFEQFDVMEQATVAADHKCDHWRKGDGDGV